MGNKTGIVMGDFAKHACRSAGPAKYSAQSFAIKKAMKKRKLLAKQNKKWNFFLIT